MLGKIVIYTLTADDAAQVNRRRTTGESIAERIALQSGTDRLRWPMGAQAHIGNTVNAGDQFPMIITRDWHSTQHRVNGQVFLDGNDTLWVLDAGLWLTMGEGRPGYWEWIE